MLRSAEFNDIYFSAENGLAETRYVFLENNNLLASFSDTDHFTIAETGFGTGLNFLAAWELFERTAPPGANLHFVSFEKFPLAPDQIRQALEPWHGEIGPYLDALLTQYPLRIPGWHRLSFKNRIHLTLVFDDVNDALPRMEIPSGVDAWFLDGFAPAKNPEMWTATVFNSMASFSNHGARFASFTAAGIVKNGLAAAGFHVEKRKGYGRKRDMIAGYYTGKNITTKPARPRNIAIVGGGLAGTACAYMLRQYGIAATIFESENTLAAGASGNPSGIFNPRLSAHRTPEANFYTSGFALAKRIFKKLPDAGHIPCGSLHLITDPDKEKKFSSCLETWAWHRAHMRIVDPAEASDVAGVKLQHRALFLPDSGQVSPNLLCRALAKNTDIRLSSPFQKGMEGDFDAVIFANGASVKSFNQTQDLPVHTVRGQIITARISPVSSQMKTNLCFGGYIGAVHNNSHVLGSTFQKWLDHTDILEQDTQDILANLEQAVPGLGIRLEDVTNARAGLRCASRDRFPVIGPATGPGNIYISTAHGSHGTVSTLAGAQILADMLTGAPWSLPRDSVNTLTPRRFSDPRIKKTS